ncbi:hypothetical protein J1N35_042598 [Gossypium stocksii]|uniref:Uncharacterized protein n=1 Tax=Gossypium stocksii TaxID=47602 RepID=A0A9D3ZE72_9ROSI|nr:hypothetical protein J1N35_042598 [Gossypium stocksii]
MFGRNVYWSIGNGRSMSFWEDVWLSALGPLAAHCISPSDANNGEDVCVWTDTATGVWQTHISYLSSNGRVYSAYRPVVSNNLHSRDDRANNWKKPAVGWIKLNVDRAMQPSSAHGSMGNGRIQNLMAVIDYIRIKHVYRESNLPADYLAKSSANG